MNTREATKALRALGWSTKTDEVGDKGALFRLPDRIARILYGARTFRDKQDFRAMLSVSTDSFSKAYAEIRGNRSNYSPLIVDWEGIDVEVPEILEEHIREASERSIAWAEAQDLEAGLLAHASRPTDAPGNRPLLHLAALAVTGDVARLKSYRASFEAGDRLGFVPYITGDYIDRAVALAEQYASNS